MADPFDQAAAALGGTDTAAAAPAQPAPQAGGSQPDPFDQAAQQLGGTDTSQATAEPGQPQAPDHQADYGGAALAGLKQTLAPFLLNKQELDGPKTKGEVATEVGTNIGTDVALGAGISMVLGPEAAPVGAAVGAAVHVVMAAYRGFGYEYARAKAEGQDFNPIRGVVNSIAQINPLVGKGNRLIKAGTQAVAEFASNYQYSGDTGSAGTSAVVGGLIAGLTHQNTGTWLAFTGAQASRPGSNTQRAGMTPSEVGDMIEAVSDRSTTGLASRAEQVIADTKEQNPDYFDIGDKLKDSRLQGAPAQLKSEMDEFKRWFLDQSGMSSTDVDGAFYHAVKVHGEDTIAADYVTFKTQKLWNQSVEDFNADGARDLLGLSAEGKVVDAADAVKDVGDAVHDPLANTWVDKVRDIKFTMRKIDDMLGSNFEGMIDNFSQAKNKTSNLMMPYIYRANKLTKAGRKLGINNQDIGRWLAEDDINTVRNFNHQAPQSIADNWSPEQRQVAEGWRGLFEDARVRLKNEGLTIDFLNQQTFDQGGKYLPMKSMTGSQGAKALRLESQRLEDKLGPDFLQHAESTDLRRAVARQLNAKDGTDLEPDLIKYRNQVDQAEQHMLSPSQKNATGYEAHSAYQRTPGLPAPEFIRDFDVGKLFTGYLNNGLKSAVYHDPFVQLNSSLETLRGMGFNNSADYLEKYLQSVSGQPSNFISGLTYLANRHKNTLEKLIEDVNPDSATAGLQTGALKAVRDLPDFAGFAISSIYPNFLGFNIRASLRDFTKPFLLTAPELGWEYGTKTVLKAIAQSAWAKLHGANFEEELGQHNLIPAPHQGIGGDVTDSGLRGVKGVGAAVENLEKFNVLSMKMYSATDKMNRYIQLKVGQQIAKDAEAGNSRAMDYLSRTLSEGNRKAVRDILDNGGSWDDVGHELGAQLVSKTSFNYGKEGMNEFGRDMGRVFSMFTKWPAMIMSDTGDLLHRYGKFGGSLKVTQRYLAPMVAMTMMSEYLLDTQHNPYQRFLIGQNLSDWAPMASWKIGTPPLLQTAQDFSKTFMDVFSAEKDRAAKMSEFGKFLSRNALAYTPGMQATNEYQRFNRAFHPEDYQP